ncbi:MAG: hypothetical protein ACI837_001704 [Crocinitomicaceae bacterium]|jgi:hypothetical protein
MNTHADKNQAADKQTVQKQASEVPSSAPLAHGFIDKRPAAKAQAKFQEMANASAHVKQLKVFQEMANKDEQSAATIQLWKENGAYVASKGANLRRDNDAHSPITKLDQDYQVYVVDKGRRVSNFKAGYKTNEHSWVEYENEDASVTGWIEDGKLSPGNLLQSAFTAGDKLYGRYEARRNLTQSGRPENKTVHGADYTIIDDVNQEMFTKGPGKGSAEVEAFRDYTHKNAKRAGGQRQDLINQYCKNALVHYTNDGKTIHFMLDGIDPELVLRETKAKRNAEDFEVDGESTGGPRVTSIELRALMRSAMRAKGLIAPKPDSEGHDVVLENVKFYMNNIEVAAPWAAKAKSAWGAAWRLYTREKRH